MSRTIVSLLPQLQQFSSSPPDEVAALRELVEDLRSALQGSDARCLALEVALRRERSRTVPPPPGFSSTVPTQPTTSISLRQGKLVPTMRIKGHSSVAGGEGTRRAARRRDIRDPLLRELKLIRSSRDGQLEEAIKYNECLEEELRWAYQEVRKLQGVESALRKENTHIRLEFFKGTICRIWPDSSWSRYNKYQDDVIGLYLTQVFISRNTCRQLDFVAANIKGYLWFLVYIIPHWNVTISIILDLLHQEAGRGGQGGSELGTSEGSEDPGAGSVGATAPVQDRPAGDRTAAVQVRTARVVASDCMGMFAHPFTHHLPVRSADL